MIKIAHGLTAWLGVVSAAIFLFLNIKDITEGVGYVYLGISVACGALIIVARMNHGSTLTIRKSTLLLLVFLTYFVAKAFFDYQDLTRIKAVTVGSSGGLIFALTFGTIVSLFLQTFFRMQKSWFSSPLPALLFYCLCVILAVIAFREHAVFLRTDVFLIDDSDGMYQRPGNFIIMISLIASLMLVQITVNKSKSRFIYKFFLALSLIAYFLLILSLLPTAQLIGSNTGFVVTFGLGGSTAIWLFLKRPIFIINFETWIKNRARLIFLIKKIMPVIVMCGLVTGLVIFMAGFLVLTKLNIDISAFRIFGFGSGELGGNSLSSRLETFSNNFMTQFLYNPLFGNLNVDTLTTGTGSYAHSLLSMFSHLGIIGTLLFSAYIIGLYREFKTLQNTEWDSVEAKLFRILAFAVIFGFALIGTFFTWMPLWFALGLLFPPLILRSHQSLRNRRSRIISSRRLLHI